jgi:asparagine synthase (glutamine-hydrolysing)
MTICGLLRLDGEPADPAVLHAMGAASTVPMPGRRWALVDGPFGVVAAAEPALGPAPAVAVDDRGLVVALDGGLGGSGGGGRGGGAGGGAPAGDAAWLLGRYQRDGEGRFDGLAGDWVTAVWDGPRRRLVCARGMLSLRRLLTWCDGRTFVFGTELRHLLAAGAPARLHQPFLAELLARSVTTFHETLLAGVERLPAGELVVATVGGLPVRRGFDTLRSVRAAARAVDLDTAATGLRPRLEAALAAALDGDATGVLVSGGVDSSAVTALARRLGATGRSRGRLVPVAVVFPGAAHDESAWLDELDGHLGTRTQRLLPAPYDWDRWRASTALAWEPPPSPSAALVADALGLLARQGVRVALTGEGGDDWFRGWRWHWPDLLRAGRLAALWRESGGGPRTPRATARRVARLGRDGAMPLLRRPDPPAPPAWLDRRWLARLGVRDRLAAALAADRSGFASHDQRGRWLLPVQRLGAPVYETAQQRHTTLGIDWRHPLRDRRVVEYVLGLHGSVLFDPAVSKPLLRRAARDVLPPAIGRRHGKGRFDAVYLDAMAARQGPRALAGHAMVREGWVDLEAARRCYEYAAGRHRAGLAPTGRHDSVTSLWPLFALAAWLDAVAVS